MKSIYIIIVLSLYLNVSQAQEKFLTKQGDISFFSSTSIEDIKAENEQVLSIIDTKDGTIAIAILMKSFMFEKSLMQEHFNENYVESDKYPKATFKGEIAAFNTLENGKSDVFIKGNITIHGVTKEIEITAELTKSSNNIVLEGKFPIDIASFNISIPSVVANNISKTIAVTFKLDHTPYSK